MATEIYGLLGYPVSHSLCPTLHHAFFRSLGLSATYELFPVAPEALASFCARLRQSPIRGFNVTVPHKVAMLSLVDRLDASARYAGALNTVHCTPAGWVGYNTDGLGFARAVEATGFAFAGCRVALLGAGGAARGILAQLILEGVAQVDLFNRTPKRATDCITHCRQCFSGAGCDGEAGSAAAVLSPTGTPVYVAAYPLEAFGDRYTRQPYDLTIQATTVGMHPNDHQAPVALETLTLDGKSLFFDGVYTPHKTLFLQQAEAQGCATVYGAAMLVHQAIYAQEIWQGRPLDQLRRSQYADCFNQS